MKKVLFVICCFSLFCLKVQAQTAGSLDQSANNAQGQYQPMNMGYAGFSSLGMTQAAWLDPLQNLGEGQSKPAYSKYYWHKDLVLPIRLREAMVTVINFPEWEMIESIQFGDSNSFAGEIAGPSSVLLWTKGNIGVDTNVIVFGRSGNKYVFYVKSEGVDTERLTNAIVDIEIPEEMGDASQGGGNGFFGGGSSGSSSMSGKTNTYTRRFQKQDWLKEIPFSPDKLVFDMEVYVPNPEDVVIAPERVWRDDVFTYIDLGEKALTMTQRPIVTQIVERSEVPVGFRTKGPNNRLIIVEAVGDFVLRNGKRLICLKMRRDDSKGFYDYTSREDDPRFANEWDVPPPLPSSNGANSGGNNGANSGASAGNQALDFDSYLNSQMGNGGKSPYSQNHVKANNAHSFSGNSQNRGSGFGVQQMTTNGYSNAFAVNAVDSNLSIQLGTGDDISEMEDLWASLSSTHSAILKKYEPFFSVDAPADGQGKELFHLRVGPIQDIEEGDNVCSQLGRKGVFCSVIRTQ